MSSARSPGGHSPASRDDIASVNSWSRRRQYSDKQKLGMLIIHSILCNASKQTSQGNPWGSTLLHASFASMPTQCCHCHPRHSESLTHRVWKLSNHVPQNPRTGGASQSCLLWVWVFCDVFHQQGVSLHQRGSYLRDKYPSKQVPRKL